MLIDWFTVAAQVLNFVILIGLMKHFLYQPVLNAIAQREKQIATSISDAAAKDNQAQKKSDEFAKKIAELDQQRASLVAKATQDAQVQRDSLLEGARKAAAALSQNLADGLKAQTQDLHRAIADRVERDVFAVVQKTLTDLAGVGLEEHTIGVFLKRLATIDEKQKVVLIASLNESKAATIRTAFELNPTQRTEVETALRKLVGEDLQVDYETSKTIIAGIELLLNCNKIAWSIGDYLDSMKDSVDELLRTKNKTVPVESAPLVALHA